MVAIDFAAVFFFQDATSIPVEVALEKPSTASSNDGPDALVVQNLRLHCV